MSDEINFREKNLFLSKSQNSPLHSFYFLVFFLLYLPLAGEGLLLLLCFFFPPFGWLGVIIMLLFFALPPFGWLGDIIVLFLPVLLLGWLGGIIKQACSHSLQSLWQLYLAKNYTLCHIL